MNSSLNVIIGMTGKSIPKVTKNVILLHLQFGKNVMMYNHFTFKETNKTMDKNIIRYAIKMYLKRQNNMSKLWNNTGL